MKKIIFLIVLLALLIGGWMKRESIPFLNNTGNETSEEISETDATNDQEDDHGHGHGHDHGTHAHDDDKTVSGNVDGFTGTKGVVNPLPVDPKLGVRAVGNPDAPIKIKEFFSLTCNHCADFHTSTYQQIKAKYIDTGVIYYIYEEFPLNGPALYGSAIARCLPEARYSGFIDILLRNQEQWAYSGNFKESLKQNAKLAGMSDEEFDTCFNDKELQKAMAANISAATDAYKISSTPSFVVNDGERVITGAKSIAVFDALVEELAGEVKTIEAPETIQDATTIETAPVEALMDAE